MPVTFCRYLTHFPTLQWSRTTFPLIAFASLIELLYSSISQSPNHAVRQKASRCRSIGVTFRVTFVASPGSVTTIITMVFVFSSGGVEVSLEGRKEVGGGLDTRDRFRDFEYLLSIPVI
jgi:hypothetical protein